MRRLFKSTPMLLAIAFVASQFLPASAGAAMPEGLKYVDPKAPCYRWPAVDFDGDGVFDRIDRCPGTARGCAVNEWGCSQDADGDGVCDDLDRCPQTPKGEKVNAQGCPDGSEPPPTPPAPPEPEPKSEFERQLVTSGKVLFQNINFETGKAVLLPGSENSLDEAGRALERYPALKVEIEGHTDSRGSASDNMKLSKERAESVRQYLLDHFKLDASHLIARGRGETQLLNREATEAERLQNRRVELNVLNPQALPGNVKIVK